MTTLKRPCFDVTSALSILNDSEGYKIHKLEPNNNVPTGLNNGQTLVFKYPGDSTTVLRLNPGKCCFRVRGCFKTKAPTVNAIANETEAEKRTRQLAADKIAKITLSPNFFWHRISSYKLKLANDDIENLSEVGPYVDSLSLFKGSEYKRCYGSLNSYIPDLNSGLADDREFLVTNEEIAEGAALPENHVKINCNSSFNEGFKKRLEEYNYNLPDDDTTGLRYFEKVFPLSDISGFFGTDKVLLNTQFELSITLKSKDNFKNCVFGQAGTDIDFGNTIDTGLTHITLELYEQKPTLEIAAELNSKFENSVIPFNYLKP